MKTDRIPLVAIADLYGHLDLFERLLERIDRLYPQARIVTLGDYVDCLWGLSPASVPASRGRRFRRKRCTCRMPSATRPWPPLTIRPGSGSWSAPTPICPESAYLPPHSRGACRTYVAYMSVSARRNRAEIVSDESMRIVFEHRRARSPD